MLESLPYSQASVHHVCLPLFFAGIAPVHRGELRAVMFAIGGHSTVSTSNWTVVNTPVLGPFDSLP